MARLQLALNVSDLDAAVDFYARLFATPPAKVRPGYANFAVADPPLKLVLFERPGGEGRLNHLGVEVETAEEVAATAGRLRDEGLDPSDPARQSCCYAVQDKTWVADPDGEPWEVYVVHGDSDVFGMTDPALTAAGSASPADGPCACTP